VVQQKPDVQPSYTFNEPKAPKIATQPVGSLNTQNPSIKALLNPEKDSENGTEDLSVEVKENQPLELETLNMHWRKYAHQLKEQNKASVFSIITKRDPKIINDFTIVFDLDSDWMKDNLTPELHGLLAYLKVNLKNGNLKIKLNILEEEKKVVNPYSPNDKFKLLVEKNPNLQMLQRMFNLDVDY
jgi:DNA polymerase-3 subunit gamma/tau